MALICADVEHRFDSLVTNEIDDRRMRNSLEAESMDQCARARAYIVHIMQLAQQTKLANRDLSFLGLPESFWPTVQRQGLQSAV